MRILPLHPEIQTFLKKKGLVEKFKKQADISIANPFHPSLNNELLNPKKLRIWSFRVDKKEQSLFFEHLV